MSSGGARRSSIRPTTCGVSGGRRWCRLEKLRKLRSGQASAIASRIRVPSSRSFRVNALDRVDRRRSHRSESDRLLRNGLWTLLHYRPTSIILVKANVCRILGPRLSADEFQRTETLVAPSTFRATGAYASFGGPFGEILGSAVP